MVQTMLPLSAPFIENMILNCVLKLNVMKIMFEPMRVMRIDLKEIRDSM